MTRTLRPTFTALAFLSWGFVVVMALLEVVHLALGQSTEHWAGVLAVQAAVLAAVFSTSARAALQSDEHVQPRG